MQNIIFEKVDRVGILTINRPEALNAINRASLLELKHFMEVDVEKEEIYVLIITGAGKKAFIAGGDIKEMNDMTQKEMLEYLNLGQDVSFLLERGKIITIAAVNGYALGGGLEIALSCDFIYASDTAKLGLPEVTLGLIPGFGGTQRLIRSVGSRRAKEMIFSGQYVSADEAQKMGMINKVFTPENLIPEAIEAAKRILKNSYFSVEEAKIVVNDGADMPIKVAMELEKQACALCFSSTDRIKGMSAFIQKRSPGFEWGKERNEVDSL